MPTFSTVVNEPNMFSEQQEEWLGDIVSARIEKDFTIVEDPQKEYLQQLADRLLSQLPPTKLHYTFTIINLAGNDSFGLAGGRIYISRKVIALLQNEDELAGLLAHEIGHIITHQAAIDFTHDFRTLLGVSQVTDRKDILDKWNQFIDNASKIDVKAADKREQQEQLIADRIAIYAMARAGYQPQKFADFFDRLAQLKSNKGSFWSDFFGRTNRNSRRLRELVHNSVPLAANCITPVSADSGERFLKWQKAVIESKLVTPKTDVAGMLARTALKPHLRSDLDVLLFSPDGKYLLAQDESNIYVVARDPMSNLFRIDAPDSFPARFSPDSRYVVFYDREYRIQKWDIEKAAQSSVHEPAISGSCLQTTISYSGDVIACLTPKYEIKLIDANTSAVIFGPRKLHEPQEFLQGIIAFLAKFEGEFMQFFTLQFSPDDRYFALDLEGSAFAYDLKARVELNLPRSIKESMGAFTFLGPDEIAGYRYIKNERHIVRLRFPSGEELDSVPTSLLGKLAKPAKGDYLLVLDNGGVAVTVLEWKTRRTLFAYKKPGLTIYDPVFAGETANGEVSISNISDRKYVSGIDLPEGPLERTQVSVFSPDGKWLAVSSKTRGAVWNLQTGERVAQTRGFEGAVFDQNSVIAHFPKHGKEPPAIIRLDTANGEAQSLYNLSSSESISDFSVQVNGVNISIASDGSHLWQCGDFLVKTSFDTSNSKGKQRFYLMEVFDVHTNKKLWDRKFENDTPHPYYSQNGHTLTMMLDTYESAKAEVKNDPALSARLNSLTEEAKKNTYVLRVLDAPTGKDRGVILVQTGNGSFLIRAARTVGDLVLVSDSANRTQVYSLKTREQKGKIMGYVFAVSPDGTRMIVENGKDKIDLYDLNSLQLISHFSFASPVEDVEFSGDNSSIMVLTTDQTVYTVKNSAPEQNASVQSSK